MKHTLTLLMALLLAPLAALHADEPASVPIKPNVLLIMADDLRDFGGAFTREVVQTPNLDRLRARGTTFERAYVQYPVGNASRCSMMTGLRAEQTGIVSNDIPLRQKLPDVITLPQLYKEAGWQSHAFGKLYHLGGGKDLKARQRWMDAGNSWHTAQAFEATPLGRKPSKVAMSPTEHLAGANGESPMVRMTISRMDKSPPPRWR